MLKSLNTGSQMSNHPGQIFYQKIVSNKHCKCFLIKSYELCFLDPIKFTNFMKFVLILREKKVYKRLF